MLSEDLDQLAKQRKYAKYGEPFTKETHFCLCYLLDGTTPSVEYVPVKGHSQELEHYLKTKFAIVEKCLYFPHQKDLRTVPKGMTSKDFMKVVKRELQEQERKNEQG